MSMVEKKPRNPVDYATMAHHEMIRRWTEERRRRSAVVRGTHGKENTGLFRFDFPNVSGRASLIQKSWHEFIEKVDGENLAFRYQEKINDGATCRFHKFVPR